jgi:uncharacterized protein (DUF885 family)
MSTTDMTAALYGLFAERLEWQKREYPEFAMARGDYRFADRLTDTSLAAQDRRYGETRALLGRLEALDRAALSTEDQLNFDLFAWDLRHEVEEYGHRTHLMPLNGTWGPHLGVAQMHERVRFRLEEDYDNYLARLAGVPRQIDDLIDVLRTGLAEGRTAPRVAVMAVPGQLDALLDGGQLDVLATPLAKHPDAARRAALQARAAQDLLPAMRAALGKLRAFVRDEYLPGARESIAAGALPNGDALYAFLLRRFTTTDLTPREVHELGLSEVARIRAEMIEVIRATDFLQQRPELAGAGESELFRAFVQYLRTDPRFYFTEPQELVRTYRDICKRVDGALPRLFRLLPRLPYGVTEIPAYAAPQQTTAYYQPGDMRNAQAGQYYVNTYRLDQRPRYEMVALSLHEAVPGHHLQIALAQELDDLPEFRRDAWFHAFGEGWALYAERLGLELGLYDDPYDNFGRLLYEMWRACRLVVDPGMHALGWSRAQAVTFMLEHTALSEHNINAEVDRYIAWPGQATAYKIGELRVRAMRAAAEQALGARFDVREFHAALLSAGTLPLKVAEERMARWTAEQAAASG